MKFGICNDVYANSKIEDVIEHAAGLGYDGLELAPFTLVDDVERFPVQRQKEIRARAADRGLELFGLHWLLVKPEGLHLTTPDAVVRQRTRDFFRTLIDMAVTLGGRVLTLGSPAQRSFRDDDTHEAATDRAVEFFRALAPTLESSGVTVALEPLEPDLTNFMSRTAETCRIVDRIGSARVGVTLDTHFVRWECATHGLSTRDLFEEVGPRLAHLHIQDDNSCAPGSGHADFDDFVTEVKRVGWQGYLSMETFPNDALGSGHEAAAEGIAFMKERFGAEDEGDSHDRAL